MSEPAGPENVLTQVLYAHYDLGEIQTPTTLPEVHQRRHRKYVVETEKGKFLLKTYTRDLAVLDALRFQHRLSAHLDEHDIPVARIQPAFSGKKIVEADNWALELQEFVEGNSMRVTGRNLAGSSDILGKFHEVCRDLPCPERDARMWRFSEVPREMFGKLYERARLHGDEAIMDRHCNNIALFLRESTNELNWEVHDEFETGLIHGDWHSGNLLYRDSELVAILDLEFAGDGCYLEDLAYAISNLCIRTSTEEAKLEQRVNLLLEFYQKHRTLAAIEEKCLYYAVGVKHVATVCYQCIQQDGLVAGYNPAQWLAILDLQTQWLLSRAHSVRQGWAGERG